MSTAPTCCAQGCVLVTGREVYPHRSDLVAVRVWVCLRCSARVGCHPGTDKPLGIPANAELRRARMLLHDRVLDPLWMNGDRARYGPRRKRRARVYRYLSEQLGITRDETHTGLFDLERCRAAWRILRAVTYHEIHELREEQKRTAQ